MRNMSSQSFLMVLWKKKSGDGTINTKIDVDLFLDVCDFHLVEHDDVMVRLFLQNLSGQDYEWYTTLATRSISSFDDLENMFLTRFSPLVTYHTLLTNYTQISLKQMREYEISISGLIKL
jgi:hypothetical protein